MPLAASGATHQGRRASNEDSWLVDLDLGLLIVADGMGGHNAGEVASALAVTVIQDTIRGNGVSPTPDRLREAVLLANTHILGAASKEPNQAGMGTTVVAVLIEAGRAFYISVGDSRAYLWRDGHLAQLTRDDSWLADALEGDEEHSDQFGTHPLRHVLTKVVGLRTDLEVTVGECPFGDGDRFLLCTDGVHGAVPHELLATMAASERPVGDVANSVIRSAIARGSTDNVTAIVARLA